MGFGHLERFAEDGGGFVLHEEQGPVGFVFGDFLHDAEVGDCCGEVAVREGRDWFGGQGRGRVAEFVDFGPDVGVGGGGRGRGRGGLGGRGGGGWGRAAVFGDGWGHGFVFAGGGVDGGGFCRRVSGVVVAEGEETVRVSLMEEIIGVGCDLPEIIPVNLVVD